MLFMFLHVTVSSSEHPDDGSFNPLFSRGREVYVQSILARIIYEFQLSLEPTLHQMFLLFFFSAYGSVSKSQDCIIQHSNNAASISIRKIDIRYLRKKTGERRGKQYFCSSPHLGSCKVSHVRP